jgi:GTPase
MSRAILVIVGRPNVGKSTLFNRMTGTKSAIVEDIPGVTRDSNYMQGEWEGKTFLVVDTGGFHPEPTEEIFGQVREQAMFAIEEGDVVVHLLDGKEGLTPADIDIARILRESGKQIVWAVNKIDGPTREERLYDFYPLGSEELWPVSAATGYGYDDFMDRIASLLPAVVSEEYQEYPKIAVAGRPNVGKSTLVNTLLSRQRMITSPEPGTTRDSIDSICSYYGRKYLIIDTAGIGRKNMTGYSLERFMAVRSLRSIERSDVTLIVLDATQGIVDQDQRIAGIVRDAGKGAVFLWNKWDLMADPDSQYRILMNELSRKMWFMQYAPVLTVSATEKKRVTKLFPLVDEIIGERKKRISTPELNRVLKELPVTVQLPQHKGKPVKIYYAAQISTAPPAFVVFTNAPAAFRDSHIRPIERLFRKHFGFTGTPVRIFVRERKRVRKG